MSTGGASRKSWLSGTYINQKTKNYVFMKVGSKFWLSKSHFNSYLIIEIVKIITLLSGVSVTA